MNMASAKKSPLELKAKLLEELEAAQAKVARFDEQRANKVAALAKKYRLVDLADSVLETEFKALGQRYKAETAEGLKAQDSQAKKSTAESTG